MIDKYTTIVIGTFLHLYRVMEGMKQESFATDIGMTHSQLSYVEHFQRMPTLAQMLNISRVCHVCINDLLGVECPHGFFSTGVAGMRTKKDALLYAEKLLAYSIEHRGDTPNNPADKK